MEKKSEFRGFIAVDIDAFPKLLDFEKEIKDSKSNIKLIKPENIHITLKFLGDTDINLIEEINNILENIVKEIKPFKIKLEGAGFFPNKNYIKIIWIGIKKEEQLKIIAQKIDNQLFKMGFKREGRKFSPHLTIGRVRSAKNKDKILKIIEKYKDFQFAEIKVNAIKLKKSELTPKGPIYTDIKKIKL